ncbi:uncharacterized protein LOC110453812 [Mizuhopecten yessoensis]|uniref:uncharacterized protein LOC110453812 n=1 Tax=Mizuhopecten yessoensis TaxID=6573 RepID=UPI000B457BF4|nr:uncharacterized protein LOC110453812 [Mizuhopecten yessoensis]
MSYGVGYKLARAPTGTHHTGPPLDSMASIRTMNRIAQVAIERIILMMNNTNLIKERRISSIAQVQTYLRGCHDDVGMSGDRGDFYRRKLAEQIHINFNVNGVTHSNVEVVVDTAIQLEKRTRATLSGCAFNTQSAPSFEIDDPILDILAKIADVF